MDLEVIADALSQYSALKRRLETGERDFEIHLLLSDYEKRMTEFWDIIFDALDDNIYIKITK
jgi:hypothetical protein